MATKEGRRLKRYQKTKPGRTKERTSEGMTSVNGWCVFLSLPTGSVKFMSFKCQVRWSLNRVTLRVREVSSFVYIYSFNVASSFVRCHIASPNFKPQGTEADVDQTIFSPTCRIYPSLIPRPCVFVACSTKFTQKALTLNQRDFKEIEGRSDVVSSSPETWLTRLLCGALVGWVVAFSRLVLPAQDRRWYV